MDRDGCTDLVCPIIRDRFNITLSAAPVKILYISFPKPASDALPNTNPCLQNSLGESFLTLGAPDDDDDSSCNNNNKLMMMGMPTLFAFYIYATLSFFL